MSDRFYTPDRLVPGEYVLAGSEAHHLATVRRFTAGDHVVLFNGDGNDYCAEVVTANRKQAVVNIVQVNATNRELACRVEIGAAMPKGDRGDFLIEKLVELGVAQFTPLLTERTIVQPREARLEKLQHAVIEASKQSGRNVLMKIGPLTRWEEFATAAHVGIRYILQPELLVGRASDGHRGSSPSLARPANKFGGILFAVGPEGGFTAKEVALAASHGWKRGSLGSRILRLETAAIAAAAWAALQ